MKIKIFREDLLRNFEIFASYCLRQDFLKKSGWINSFKDKQSIDREGHPIPWMTYPFINFIEERLKSNMEIFEYGCGNSTMWWSKHVKRVVSCEHSRTWYEKYKTEVPPNVELHHINLEYGGRYSQKIKDYNEEFDIVIIDGRDRINCCLNSLKALKKDGIIIWDNSDREEYRKGYIYLTENQYKRLDFYGLGPINVYSWCTSIFYREENCLDI